MTLVRVEAEFVVQDGECGQKIIGLRVLLNAKDFTRYADNTYFSDVVVPMMTKRFIEDIDAMKAAGKLWEGAYLTTHPEDLK